MALSSGFMTYPDDIHPSYGRLCREICDNPRTAVLLASFDYETCVAETVRRQLGRPFSRTPEQEEQVIRTRYYVYSRLPVSRFETAGPIDAVVDNLVAHLLPSLQSPTASAAFDVS
jgi:shikimate kinase